LANCIKVAMPTQGFDDSGRADTMRCENPDCNKRFVYLAACRTWSHER